MSQTEILRLGHCRTTAGTKKGRLLLHWITPSWNGCGQKSEIQLPRLQILYGGKKTCTLQEDQSHFQGSGKPNLSMKHFEE